MEQGRLADLDHVGLAHHGHRGRARLPGDEGHLAEQRVLEQVGNVLGPLRAVHEDAQLAACDQEERIANIPLPHDQMAVLEAQDGERTRHRDERFLRQLGEKRQRVVLLLVADVDREIEGGAHGVLGGVQQRLGGGAAAGVELGAGIDGRGTDGEAGQIRRTRGVGLDQQGLDVLDGVAELDQGVAGDQRRQRVAGANVVDSHRPVDLDRVIMRPRLDEHVRDQGAHLVVEGNCFENVLVDRESTRVIPLLAQDSRLGPGLTQGGDHGQ